MEIGRNFFYERSFTDFYTEPWFDSFLDDNGDIDEEGKNIHYVAVTRPKEELYFMIYDEF